MSHLEVTIAGESDAAATLLACLKADGKELSPPPGKTFEKEEEGFAIPQRYTKSGRKKSVPFSLKLMKVLSNKKYEHIIKWMPSGKSFLILDNKSFVSEILPEHFKTAKYSSFTRKLHRWGFMRHYRGPEAGAFYHEKFQRGQMEMAEEMSCEKTEPSKSVAAMSSNKAKMNYEPVANIATNKPQCPSARAVQPVTHAAPYRPLTFSASPQITRMVPSKTLTPMMGISAPRAFGNTALAPMVPQQLSQNSRLKAAIDHEVARRMKERIAAIQFSRHAHAISALRQQQFAAAALPPAQSTYSQIAAALMRQKQAGNLGPGLPAVALPMTSDRFRNLTNQGLLLPGAPPTNIQGARTA